MPLNKRIYASFSSRLFACVIDVFINIFLSLLVIKAFLVYQASYSENLFLEITNNKDFFIIYTLISSGYEIFLTYYFAGKTIGKMILKIKVINLNKQKFGFKETVYRYLAIRLSCLTFGLGFIYMQLSKNKQTLHDIICNTYVVRSKV